MNQTARRALEKLRELKSVTFATVDQGMPSARIIDVMDVDEEGLLFLTGRGKAFYRQLTATGRVAVCGMDENYLTVRLSGQAEALNSQAAIDLIFEKNPMMNDLYPGEKRDILEAFKVRHGFGEIFDLSREPPRRERFSLGGEKVNPSGMGINQNCTGCGLCAQACPVGAICEGEIYEINGNHCLECGRCLEACPEGAIDPAPGF